MKAMIMAAGVGSRLMPLTTNIPKPMVPVANKPVMEHAVNLLSKYDIQEIISNLHYLPEVIKDHFGDGSKFDVSLSYSEEKHLLGTAGGVKNNEWFLDDTFVVLSGDALTDINIRKMLEFHREKGALATIALKQVENVEQFGVVITDQTGKIKSFQEKPKREEALSNLVNTGIYIFEPEIFEYIPKGEIYDFGKELFPLLVEKGLAFYGYETKEYWCDVGSLEVYRQAQYDVLEGRVNVSVLRDAKFSMHPTAKVHGKVIVGEGTNIGKDVEIFGPAVIGTNCQIAAQTVIKKSILLDGVCTEPDSILNESIVSTDCVITTQ